MVLNTACAYIFCWVFKKHSQRLYLWEVFVLILIWGGFSWSFFFRFQNCKQRYPFGGFSWFLIIGHSTGSSSITEQSACLLQAAIFKKYSARESAFGIRNKMIAEKPSWIRHEGMQIFSIDVQPGGLRFATGGGDHKV